MRITCPSCGAAYEVPDSLLTPGRTVRCARCQREWMSAPSPASEIAEPMPEAAPTPDEAATAPPAALPALTAMDRLAAQAPKPSSPWPLRLAWLASLLVLVGAAGAAYAWRQEVIVLWPPSERVYAVFGSQTVTR